MIHPSALSQYACNKFNSSVQKLMKGKLENAGDYALLNRIVERIQLANLHKTTNFDAQQLLLQLLKIETDIMHLNRIKNIVSRTFGKFLTLISNEDVALKVDYATFAQHSLHFLQKKFIEDPETPPPVCKFDYSTSVLEFSISYLLDVISPSTLKKGEFPSALHLLHVLTDDAIDSRLVPLNQLQTAFPAILGPEIWERNGWKEELQEVEVVPPRYIQAVLEKDCLEFPGRKIAESNLLTWIPDNLTMDRLIALTKGLFPKNPRGFLTYELVGKPMEAELPGIKAHWILMSKEPLPGSDAEIAKMRLNEVEDSFLCGGQLPTLLEAASCILLHYLATGERLYENCFALCQSIEGQLFAIGGFKKEGLQILQAQKALPLGCAIMRRM